MSFPRPTWTPEQDARLRELDAEGIPYAEIARQLGVTKNTIAGRAYRLQLPGRKRSRTAKRSPLALVPHHDSGCLFPLWGPKERPTHEYCNEEGSAGGAGERWEAVSVSPGSHLNAVKSAASRVRMVGAESEAPRQKDDFYPTPLRGIEALLGAESFDGPIWEPACGDGAISRVLEGAGHRVISSDLVDRGYGETGIDFLMEWQPRAPNIITNPPFKLSVPFVRKSLELTTGKVAMLLKVAFLEGIERGVLFETSPLARVHVFKQRLSFAPGGGARKLEGGGMMAFAWFVWDQAHTGKPTLGWI